MSSTTKLRHSKRNYVRRPFRDIRNVTPTYHGLLSNEGSSCFKHASFLRLPT